MSLVPDERLRPCNAPQYGLRTLLWSMAALSALFAALSALSMKAAVFACFILCLIVVHLAAAAVGTRLRNRTTGQLLNQAIDRQKPGLRPQQQFPPTGLRVTTPVGPWFLLAALIGALSGGLFGWLALSFWGRVSMAGLFVGSLSSAFIAALAGWLAATFLSISSKAIREASQHR